MPTIRSSTYINGYSQLGASENDLDFSKNGIYIGDNAVICVVLEGATHNIADGLLVPASAPANAQLLVHGLGFSGFTHGAVTLYGGSAHTILGNRIGGAVGNMNLSPSGTGVIVGPGVSRSYVGGTDPGQRNIIGDAIGDGIVDSGSTGSTPAAHDNQILNNLVGTGAGSPSSLLHEPRQWRQRHSCGRQRQYDQRQCRRLQRQRRHRSGWQWCQQHTQWTTTRSAVRDFTRVLMSNASMGVRAENGAHANAIAITRSATTPAPACASSAVKAIRSARTRFMRTVRTESIWPRAGDRTTTTERCRSSTTPIAARISSADAGNGLDLWRLRQRDADDTAR